MTWLARMQKVLVLAPARLGRWYGPSCAIAGACVASAVWAVAVSSSRPQGELGRATVVTMIDADEQQPHALPPMLTPDPLPEQATCAADEFRPLHEREDYCVEPPDILHFDVSCEGAADQILVASMSTEYLVAPDGLIDLGGQFGGISAAGKTLREIEDAVEDCLADTVSQPQVCAAVIAQNSHVYYVIVENSSAGDFVHRFPALGNESVLSVIRQIDDVNLPEKKSIWIARPRPGGTSADEILSVNWNDVASGASAATNHPILPGDRVFVGENRLIALDWVLDQITMPFRQLLGLDAAAPAEDCPCEADQRVLRVYSY